MTANDQTQLGNTLWKIANELRGAMNVEKIATCLSAVDEIINAQSQKIEALKLHKKGLLQGLFPKANA